MEIVSFNLATGKTTILSKLDISSFYLDTDQSVSKNELSKLFSSATKQYLVAKEIPGEANKPLFYQKMPIGGLVLLNENNFTTICNYLTFTKLFVNRFDLKGFNQVKKYLVEIKDKNWVNLAIAAANYIGSSSHEDLDSYFKDIAKYTGKQYQKVDATTLYRGIKISSAALKKVLNKESIELKERKFTSWSTDKKVGLDYAKGVRVNSNADEKESSLRRKRKLPGICLQVPVSSVDILLNMDYFSGFFGEGEKINETLIKGSGIIEVTKKSIVKVFPNGVA
jgi:hypothetical protein